MNFRSIPSLLFILFIDIEVVQCILNGYKAVSGDFKHHVSLWSRVRHGCGGVIIDDVHILTAGHCVSNTEAEYLIFAGRTDVISQNPIIREVKTIHLHPDFKPTFEPTIRQLINLVPYHSENDVAILTLTKRLDFNGPVAAISLPTDDVFRCQTIESCEIAGWGAFAPGSSMPLQLLWAKVNVYGSDICGLLDTSVRDNELCAIDLQGITTLLKGDSGGGLVCNGLLVGIASGTRSDPQYPTIYAKVYDFLPFITEVTGIDRGNAGVNRKKRNKDDEL